MFISGFCVKVTCVIVYYNAYDKKENCQNFIQFFKIEKWRYLPHSWSFNSHISIFLYDLYSLYLSLSALYLSKSLDTSLHLSIYLCISLYHSISLYSLYLFLSALYLSTSLDTSLHLSIYLCISLYHSISLHVYLYISIYIDISFRFSLYLYVSISNLYSSLYISLYLSISFYVYICNCEVCWGGGLVRLHDILDKSYKHS